MCHIIGVSKFVMGPRRRFHLSRLLGNSAFLMFVCFVFIYLSFFPYLRYLRFGIRKELSNDSKKILLRFLRPIVSDVFFIFF